MAKMKIMTNGRHLWSRIIGSTICGEFVDSILFYPLAFYGAGMIPNELLPSLVQSQFIAKTLVEVIMTPVTYAVVNFLRRQSRAARAWALDSFRQTYRQTNTGP
jgi:queuosine precursor transporter